MAAKKGIRQIAIVREGQRVVFDLADLSVSNPAQFGGEGGLAMSGPDDGDGIEFDFDTMHIWNGLTIEFDPAPDARPIPVRRYVVDA